MSVKLDNLDLNIRQGDSSKGTLDEVRSIRKLGIHDKRKLSEHRGSSTYGSILSDNGRHSMRIIIEGDFFGKNAKQTMTLLRSKYKAGKPLPLISELTLLSQLHNVLIEELNVYTLWKLPICYSYSMILREYKEPKQQAPGGLGLAAPSQIAQAKSGVERQSMNIMQSLNGIGQTAAQ